MNIFNKDKKDKESEGAEVFKKVESFKKPETAKETEVVKEAEVFKKAEIVKEAEVDKTPKVVRNNSAFKRAVTQMGMKPGDKITAVFDDGSRYEVECKR